MFGIKKSKSSVEHEKPADQLTDEELNRTLNEIVDQAISQDASAEAALAESAPAASEAEVSEGSTASTDDKSKFTDRVFKKAPAQFLKPSIVSEGFQLKGDIKSSGGLHVEGEIIGNVYVESLTIGSRGMVSGSVECNTLNIKGRFDGDAKCNSLSMSGNAVVNGDVSYKTLIMSAGTILTGNLKRAV